MYKVLIVDDEPLVQVGVKSMLNWPEYNMEICGTATNGEIALEIINRERPHIVITDIKMPIMDGLTLLKRCYESFGTDKPLFIMLTSYEDFHMARESITYQAMDYLVKVELTPELLKKTILHARDELDKKAAQIVNSPSVSETSLSTYNYIDKFMISLINNLFESEEQMNLQAEHLKIDLKHKGYLCCYGAFESGAATVSRDKLFARYESSLQMVHELAGKYIPCRAFALDISHFAIIFFYDGEDDRNAQKELSASLGTVFSKIHTSLVNYYNVNMRCGIGSYCTAPSGITDSYQAARLSFSKTDSAVPIVSLLDMDTMSHDTFNISLFKADLTKAFEEFDSELLKGTLDSLCELIGSHPHHYVQALDAASNILYLAISLMREGEQVLSDIFRDSPDGYLSLYRQTNVAQISGWLQFLSENMCALFDERRKDYKNRIVMEVKAYINDHLGEKLTLNEVAAHFAISSCYLSQLFSRYNDTGFSEYINIMKIQEAKRLLRNEHRKVYEVAEMLSFGSEFYFSKVFKKVEGISPTDFLNNE